MIASSAFSPVQSRRISPTAKTPSSGRFKGDVDMYTAQKRKTDGPGVLIAEGAESPGPTPKKSRKVIKDTKGKTKEANSWPGYFDEVS